MSPPVPLQPAPAPPLISPTTQLVLNAITRLPIFMVAIVFSINVIILFQGPLELPL